MKWWSIVTVTASLMACGRLGYDPTAIDDAGVGTPCDDGSDCTDNDTIDTSGTCVGIPKAAGSGCDDGLACTENDQCDSGGLCEGTPNDSLCPADGSLCQPGCFAGPSGCGIAPTSIAVSCDPTGAAGEAKCAVTTAGGTGVPSSSCVTCETSVGFVPLLFSSFEDSAGMCNQGDWQLASGNQCRDSVAGCNSQGALVQCCDDFTSMCNEAFGISFLQSVLEENCGGGGFKEFRATHLASSEGVQDIRLCYDASEAFADGLDAVIAQVGDGTNLEQLDCVPGDTDWRGGFETRCTSLPAWADDNPALFAEFIVHNNSPSPDYPNDVRRMSLDNVTVYGLDPACPTAKRSIVFEEDFGGCPDPIPDGYNGWTVASGTPGCNFSACSGGGQGAVAENDSWEIQRRVDTTALSGDVQLCFNTGHVNANDVTEGVSASIDLGDGVWRLIGRGSLYRASDSQCDQKCFNLSAADPAVAHNPNLGIELRGFSSAAGRRTFIDDITVSGVESCSGDAFVSAGPLGDAGADAFDLTLQNQSAQAINAQLTCTWDGAGQRSSASTMVSLD